ncbi:ATP-dependent DNA helicase RecG [Nakamurella multipartita DSM 44233]|uniref:Probable DNA 3'-5' helicase RecG n=1 Tax=Nakamurella multipartita (strain ATCC 700099 / DSM 44233 / CIP 104796 / JCM 9543 / NBRC 105858 / Y-104) TaxID=479431 RepID=C8XH57_NAKMY|nr:ATP-dependent DNA helicase RecG [Nakamurella multipartita]ACV78263.1 ATP-dependent DNA helicase RecG [Nakamurella multipartita DSM 44233]
MEQIGLDTPLKELIGARTAGRLADKLELATVGDLLRYYPRKYDQRGRLTDLGKLVVGERATVWARVVKVVEKELGHRGPGRGARGRGGGVKHITKVVIGDDHRQLTCTFFNQYHWTKTLPPGTDAMFSGKITKFQTELQMSSPSVAILSDGRGSDGSTENNPIEIIESFPGGVIPVYPLVEGVTQAVLQRSVRLLLDLGPRIEDPVPEVLLAQRGLVDLATALHDIHRPRTQEHLDRAKARLRYDEALSVQLVLARRKALAREFPAEPCPRVPGGLLDAFDANLPFELTAGQRAVGEAIGTDLATIHPMNRLLQGEVGSGKTVVALRAMLQVIDSGRQAVMLAPTEVLAAQHARSLRQVLGPLGRGGELGAPAESTAITLLTGSLPAKARKLALLTIASGQAGIVVGTHALLSEGVFFANLGLIVVDEQHRFGVEQRHALRTKHPDGSPPHVLVMTATPIPRTVAMTVFGDLDTSTLDELPRGRSPIGTTVVPAAEKPAWVERAWQRIREEVGKGHQAYVVCPKIGDGSGEDAAGELFEDGSVAETDSDAEGESTRRAPLAVTQVAAMLRDGPLADLRVGVLHGRLVPAEKDAVMTAFAAGELDVLVATTVIEVGVDVPNATMMVIMDAERFGMSQLHQLRGRVGRGSAPGICLLVTESPEGTPGRFRLAAVAATTDGFELAEADLELRREGNVLGTEQAGKSTALRQLSLLRDRDVIEDARTDAAGLVGDDPAMARWPGLADMVSAVIAEQDQDYLDKG